MLAEVRLRKSEKGEERGWVLKLAVARAATENPEAEERRGRVKKCLKDSLTVEARARLGRGEQEGRTEGFVDGVDANAGLETIRIRSRRGKNVAVARPGRDRIFMVGGGAACPGEICQSNLSGCALVLELRQQARSKVAP
ncbi:hypothetical protein BD289DRAFT_227105 [Coniella lustricola]|uniref:Uncharacterized protein n=1 Tax=Coniella lustricola TaxID=2025994 RepID=A0A2T3AAN1_9PEZI|nr:hypothetical protein BD289DRAFT_227105 [Coniella lustricola]